LKAEEEKRERKKKEEEEEEEEEEAEEAESVVLNRVGVYDAPKALLTKTYVYTYTHDLGEHVQGRLSLFWIFWNPVAPLQKM
jgi:hypothetical protein